MEDFKRYQKSIENDLFKCTNPRRGRDMDGTLHTDVNLKPVEKLENNL